jgi:hypothetical protein
VRSLLLVVPLLASLAACWRTDPLYCERNADCADVAGRPFCDVDGTYAASDGIARTCIADPGGSCTLDVECTDPALPACSNGACRECSPTHACGPDQPVCDVAESTCAGCTSATDCAAFADRPTCSPEDGACVGCTSDLDCAATGQACLESTRTCGACTADADCESGLCDEELGTCIAAVNILHVDAKSASQGPECSASAPCRTLLEAHARVQGDRKYVLVHPGSYDGSTLEGKTMTIVGYRAIILGSMRVGGPSITLEGFEMRRGKLEIAGAGVALLDHIRVTQNIDTNYNAIVVDNDATTIRSSIVDNNPTIGIITNGSRPTVTTIQDSIIRNNSLYGVYAANQQVATTIERCRIEDNGSGGIAIGGARFSIINNFISGNSYPTAGYPWAGIEVSGGESSSQIEHNTIVGNEGPGPSGITCTSNTTGMVFRNNIIWGNHAAADGAQVSGPCQHRYSIIGPGPAVGGQGNSSADPLVADLAGRDLHVLPSSPARDAADPSRDRSAPALTVQTDIDGEQRPIGGRADIGADELP